MAIFVIRYIQLLASSATVGAHLGRSPATSAGGTWFETLKKC